MPVKPRGAISEDIDVAILGAGCLRHAGRHHLKKAGVTNVPEHRSGRRLRRRLVLEPLSRHPVRQRRLLLPAAARRDRLHAVEEVRRRLGDLRLHASGSPTSSALPTSALFHTLVTALRWDESIKRWRISTNRGDDIRARFVDHGRRPAEHAQAARHSRASTSFKGKMFHTARWDYDYTGGELARTRCSTSSPTSASRSSAPARPRSRPCPISASTPSSSTSCSARLRPSTSAPIRRPIPNG